MIHNHSSSGNFYLCSYSISLTLLFSRVDLCGGADCAAHQCWFRKGKRGWKSVSPWAVPSQRKRSLFLIYLPRRVPFLNWYSDNGFSRSSSALCVCASITNDKSQRELSRWGDHVDGAQPARLWGFFSARKGGHARGPLQLNPYLSNLDHILFHRIRSNISEHLLQGKTSRFEWNRAIS